ncbi:MAG: ferrochelatase [Campylobacterales bacterium]|nr:ferrochelatase [Campylobacterales bacterium]
MSKTATAPKKALLLLNMGGPNTLSEVPLFLNNMFNDKRILPFPKPLRSVLAWLITRFRQKQARYNYSLIGGKSPIGAHTRRVVDALSARIDADVHYAMRYTPPFTEEVLSCLLHYDKIYAIPMYPHFSSTTTLSSFDVLYEEAERLGIAHKLKRVEHYYSHPSYIAAIVERIKEALGEDNPEEFELVFSAHGLTKKIIEEGDPYQRHIRANLYYARRALNAAGIFFHKTHLAYQSRLGPMEWIRPYLEDKLASLSKKKVIIYPIAFTVDNSETECELDIEYREKADELGFEEYRVALAPNAHPFFIDALEDLYLSMDTASAVQRL